MREVANYVRALESGLQRVREIPISTRLMKELHATLLQEVRGGDSSKPPGGKVEAGRRTQFIRRLLAQLRDESRWIVSPGMVDGKNVRRKSQDQGRSTGLLRHRERTQKEGP